MGSRLPRWLIGVTLAVYACLHLPSLVLVGFWFYDSKFSASWAGFTRAWYYRLRARPDIDAALFDRLLGALAEYRRTHP